MTHLLYKNIISHISKRRGIDRCLKLSGAYINQKKCNNRYLSDDIQNSSTKATHNIGDKYYPVDSWTNITPKILSYMNRNLHNTKHHPLQIIKQRIVNYIYSHYPGRMGPLFSVYDQVI